MQLQLAHEPHLARPGDAPLALAPLDAALLAWLAVEGPTPRARLALLLWPEKDPEAARNSLRQRLFHLHRRGGRALVLGTATLALAPDLQHDLADADGVLGTWEPPPEAGEFVAWLAHQRHRRGRRVRDGLAELARMAEGVRDYPDALTHARELLALDPLSEDAHRRVIRLHYLAGDRAAALIAFDACERVLKDEVGTRPSAESLALLALIERDSAAGDTPQVLPAALLRPPQLVGREAELGVLRAAWRAGQPFVLLGEAGIGKSRLLESLAAGWPGACLVRARPGDCGVPLALLARLLDALGAAQPTLRTLPASVRLAEALQPAWGATHGERPQPQPLAAPLTELLAAAAAEAPPLALLLDDWQFADAASVALLGAALPSSMCVGHASRDSTDAEGLARLAALRQDSARHVLTLQPLAAPAVQALLASVGVEAGTDADALGLALRRRVGGSPLYLLEALRRMHDQDLPLQAANVAAPRLVRDLVAERLRALGDATRSLLRIAVIAGDDFGVALAEAVSGRDALALADDWHRLEALGLLGGKAVAHDVYAEVVQAELPAPIAALLHARVASWLEAQPPASRDSARLAAHWLAAGDDARAVPHLLAAARHAWCSARAEETFEAFARAAQIEAAQQHLDAAFDHWFDNADAMSDIGSAALYAQCLQGLTPLARNARQGLRLRMAQAVQRWQSGETEGGLSDIGALLTQAIALGDDRVEGECRFALAHRAAADGRFDDAVQQLAAGERLLRERGEQRRAVALAGSISLVLGIRGQPRLALAEQARVLPLIEQQRDHATACVVLASRALQQVRQGFIEAGVDDARTVLQRLGGLSVGAADLTLALGYLIDALRWAGRLDLALQAGTLLQARLATLDAGALGLVPRVALALHLGRADLAHAPLAQLGAVRALRARERSQLALLRLQAALIGGGAPPATTAAAEAGDDMGLAAEWALWRGWMDDTTQASAGPLAEQAAAAGSVLFAAPLAALARWQALQRREPMIASAAAQRSAPTPDSSADPCLPEPAPIAGACVWSALFEARIAAHLGDRERARASAQRAAAWLQGSAQQSLTPSMAAAFLERHPVHRELLTRA